MAGRFEVAQLSPGFIEPNVSNLLESDRRELWRVINEAFAEYETFIGKPYERFPSYEHFLESLTDASNHYLFIKANNAYLAGVCYREPTDQSSLLYFGTLWVSVMHRNKGLASQLIYQLEREARKRGLTGLSIQLYRIPALIDLYRRHHGFVFAIDENHGKMVKHFVCK